MKKKIVIGGSGRSGTTLLLNILGTHPEIHPIVEPFWLQWIFNYLDNINEPGKRDWLLNAIKARCWENVPLNRVSKLGLADPLEGILSKERFFEQFNKLLNDIEKHPTDKNYSYRVFGQYIDDIYTQIANKYSKPYWCEKTPPNILVASNIVKAIPDVKFIWIYRYPLDVIASNKDLGWWGGTVEKIWEKFKLYMDSGFKCRETLSPENFLEVKMEDILFTTSKLRNIYSWLDLEYNPIGKNIDHPSFRREINIENAHIGRYKEELTKEEREILINLGINDVIKKLGYNKPCKI